MKITALEEYGLRCMLLLAQHGVESPLTLPEIGAKEGLSIPYAGKLLMILKQAGLARAVRGRLGGYVLSKAPERIYLKEIFEALGEPMYSSGHCQRYTGEYDECVHTPDCNVKRMWIGFERFVNNLFENVTLADLQSGSYDLLRQSKKSKKRRRHDAGAGKRGAVVS